MNLSSHYANDTNQLYGTGTTSSLYVIVELSFYEIMVLYYIGKCQMHSLQHFVFTCPIVYVQRNAIHRNTWLAKNTSLTH